MTKPIPAQAAGLLEGQKDVIARSQAAPSGLDAMTIRNRLRYGRWQRLQRGVYAAFPGEPGRETELWAALLRAGPGATLSHQTAAERHRLVQEPRPDEPSPPIHITVPSNRRPAQLSRIPGVVIHRSAAIDRTRHPAMSPPCTRVDDTVLDLIEAAEAFADAGDGALSLLEYRYVRYVERPHGLPTAKRQELVRQRTGNRYLDNLYEEYRVCIELDGTAAHPADEQWEDKRRDSWNLVHSNIVTLRFGFLDLAEPLRCATAQDVATRLTLSGWPGRPHPCLRAGCPVGVIHEPLPHQPPLHLSPWRAWRRCPLRAAARR